MIKIDDMADDLDTYMRVVKMAAQYGYERPDEYIWETYKIKQLSSKVRTLDDMSEEEIKNIEKTYRAKVIRRKK